MTMLTIYRNEQYQPLKKQFTLMLKFEGRLRRKIHLFSRFLTIFKPNLLLFLTTRRLVRGHSINSFNHLDTFVFILIPL